MKLNAQDLVSFRIRQVETIRSSTNIWCTSQLQLFSQGVLHFIIGDPWGHFL